MKILYYGNCQTTKNKKKISSFMKIYKQKEVKTYKLRQCLGDY